MFSIPGKDLLTFKYNLRQRTPVKHQNQVADSNETEELYSPIVSEYMPPQENGSYCLFIL